MGFQVLILGSSLLKTKLWALKSSQIIFRLQFTYLSWKFGPLGCVCTLFIIFSVMYTCAKGCTKLSTTLDITCPQITNEDDFQPHRWFFEMAKCWYYDIQNMEWEMSCEVWNDVATSCWPIKRGRATVMLHWLFMWDKFYYHVIHQYYINLYQTYILIACWFRRYNSWSCCSSRFTLFVIVTPIKYCKYCNLYIGFNIKGRDPRHYWVCDTKKTQW